MFPRSVSCRAACRLARGVLVFFSYRLFAPCSIEYTAWLRLLACRCRGRCRCSLISSSHHIVVRCRPALPACLRLVFPSSRPISSPVVSPVVSPLFDTVGRGVRRGASGVLLAWFFPAVCADVDSLSMPYHPAMSSRSACLSARLRGRWRFHLVRAGCVVMSCLPRRVVSSLVSFIIPSVGSAYLVSRPVLRHDGRGGGRMRRGAIRFSPPVLFPCACLLRNRFSPSI